MTTEEYYNLDRFETGINCSFEEFYDALKIRTGTIFEVITTENTHTYAIITESLFNSLFDIAECTASGEILTKGIRCGSVHFSQFANLLYQGNWRIYGKVASDYVSTCCTEFGEKICFNHK